MRLVNIGWIRHEEIFSHDGVEHQRYLGVATNLETMEVVQLDPSWNVVPVQWKDIDWQMYAAIHEVYFDESPGYKGDWLD